MLLWTLAKRGWDQVIMWREISRQRNELRRLSESLAKDIGISRAEAEREADRHFWDYDREEQGALRIEKEIDEGAADRGGCCLQP